ILGWLTFRAMVPLLERFGPTAVMFPHLRGNPWVDQWLRQMGLAEVEARGPTPEAACAWLPNQFVAIVPAERLEQGTEHNAGRAEACATLAELCAESAKEAWQQLADAVRRLLNGQIAANAVPCAEGWARLWDRQVDGYFEFRSVALPLAECSEERLAELLSGHHSIEQLYPEVFALRRLAELLGGDGSDGATIGRWQLQMALARKLLEAASCLRHFPGAAEPTGPAPAKCSMLGGIEQMGPGPAADSARFWYAFAERVQLKGVGVGPGERLSAVALVKRFAGPVRLAEELGTGTTYPPRLPDTATVAAAEWLRRAREAGFGLEPDAIRREHGCWTGRWLHWPGRELDCSGPP
ncbi:MAG TPA: hypothetical protein EYP14_03620, partial [Planctomycetaceae bacterium]|nr:hypothetical protein [Planctomycetaceae bacterium]